MFLKDIELSVNFILPATVVTYLFSDFDIIVKEPNGNSTYYESGILEENFIAPTPTTAGAITYKFTPNAEGVWIVVLTTGVAAATEFQLEYPFRVSVNDTTVYQQVKIG